MAGRPSGDGLTTAAAIAPRRPADPPWRGTGGAMLGRARVRFTARVDGDMAGASGTDAAVSGRRRAVVDRSWTWLRQVHGARVITATGPGDGAGTEADGAISAAPGVALAVLTADCGPVALASPEGIIGVAHAGWRGLLAGVVPETVAAMRALGATDVIAALGPCVHPECYPFGDAELDLLVAEFGEGARGVSHDGAPALDLPAAIRVSLRQADVRLVHGDDVCTSCSDGHWSWRAARDPERQATVVWLP